VHTCGTISIAPTFFNILQLRRQSRLEQIMVARVSIASAFIPLMARMRANRPAPLRSPAGWGVAAAAVATVAAYGGHLISVRAADAPAASEMAVTVAKAKRVCFTDTLPVTGVLVPRSEILVRPDREGLQISQVLVQPGDTVSSGQVLARLIPPDWQGAPPGGQQAGATSTAVASPAAGVVSSLAAIIGTMASARGEPLFRIAAQGEMELLAETPAKTLASLSVNQPARMEILGVGELSGKVRAVSTTINPMTQLGEVRVFAGSDPRLRVGAFGRAIIDIAQRCGPAIPMSAILYGSSGTIVQVVRDEQIETRRVDVGLFAGGQAEIREGVSEGDEVVSRAGAFLREGDRVRPVTASEPASHR
jgi:HlyD family secretion protein